MQPLEETYNNDLLESYQKACNINSHILNLMRNRIPYEEWPDICKIAGVSDELLGPSEKPVLLGNHILNRIQDIGRIEEKISILLKDEIFEMLSKHNPYWVAEKEDEEDKLDDLRRKLCAIQNTLWDIKEIINDDHEC